MKTVPRYHLDGDLVKAYQKKDIDPNVIIQAKEKWHLEWLRQGGEDEGTCCGGKGLEIWFLRKGRRVAEPVNVVSCDWVQGNLSAERSHGPALEYLKEYGDIEARYNDGWMD